MKYGFLKDWTMPMAIRTASKVLLNKTWLIVTLDSSRGEDLHKSFDYLKARLPKNAKWTSSGIRLEGFDIPALLKESDIIVHFSAAYVVDGDVLEFPTLYNVTSETETFESALPNSLKENLLKPGVHAYFADGCGLNYCFANDSIAVKFIEGTKQ